MILFSVFVETACFTHLSFNLEDTARISFKNAPSKHSSNQIRIVPRVNKEVKAVSATLLNISVLYREKLKIVIENSINTEYCTVVDSFAEDKRLC